MATGYECDNCGGFTEDSPYGGNGPKGEDIYDVGEISAWVTFTKRNTRTQLDLCHRCEHSFLADLIAEWQANYL
jgi:hypothetical protein